MHRELQINIIVNILRNTDISIHIPRYFYFNDIYINICQIKKIIYENIFGVNRLIC